MPDAGRHRNGRVRYADGKFVLPCSPDDAPLMPLRESGAYRITRPAVAKRGTDPEGADGSGGPLKYMMIPKGRDAGPSKG